MRATDRSDLTLGNRFRFDWNDTQDYEVVAAYPDGSRYFKRPFNGGWAKLADGPEVWVVGGRR